MEELVKELVEEGHLKTPRIIEAFRAIDRADFVPQDMQGIAYANEALAIGEGQTISQPQVVAFMLELLQPEQNQHILDIGAGSGWTTALLAHIAGKQGRVTALEVVEELAEFGRTNVAKYGFLEQGRVEFLRQSGQEGYAKMAPYERILVSASWQHGDIPKAWREQLAPAGIMVAVIGESIWKFQKQERGELKGEEFPGFLFVPFI